MNKYLDATKNTGETAILLLLLCGEIPA